LSESGSPPRSPNVTWHAADAARAQPGATVWLTGLSGSGKSTVAVELLSALVERGVPAYSLDGDNLRHGLNGDLGFSADDRTENVRRVGEVARLFADAGVVAVVPVISPYRAGRDHARQIHEDAGLVFVEVFVDTPIEVCEARDVKGLYAKARAGELPGFTGIDDPYELPEDPDLVIAGDRTAPADAAARIVDVLIGQGVVPESSG
jgi:adenylyl-sulfate kinase